MGDDTDQQTIPDPTAHMDFDVDAGEVRSMANRLQHAEVFDGEDLDTDEIAKLVSALKELENAAEDARKEYIEPVLSERVAVGETAWDLKRMEGSRRYVTDNEGAFDAVLDAGHDPRTVAKVNVGDLVDTLGQEAASEFLGESTYDYFRREG